MRVTVFSDLLENFTYNYYLESNHNQTGCIVAPQQELVRLPSQPVKNWDTPQGPICRAYKVSLVKLMSSGRHKTHKSFQNKIHLNPFPGLPLPQMA